MAQPKRREKAEPAPAAANEPTTPGQDGAPWVRPPGLSNAGRAAIAAVVLLINLPLIHYAFFRGQPDAPLPLPYSDDYSDRETVQRNYNSTGGHWRVVNGELLSPGVKNNPLWLKAKLPRDVAVEFDVRSESQEGDIKVEIFGDGSDHASGYVLIHGGWNNSISVIARLNEHGEAYPQLQARAMRFAREQRRPDADALTPQLLRDTGVFKPDTGMRVEASPYPVQIGRKYHWRIERRGSLMRWLIDGKPFMEFDDPFPLEGAGHDRLGFSSWEAQLYFDNLKVEAL